MTDRAFITVGFKCYFRWDLYYVHLGPVITLVPSTSDIIQSYGEAFSTFEKQHRDTFQFGRRLFFS